LEQAELIVSDGQELASAKRHRYDRHWGGNGPADLSPGTGRAASGENRWANGAGMHGVVESCRWSL
jgi:hypothetical protein